MIQRSDLASINFPYWRMIDLGGGGDVTSKPLPPKYGNMREVLIFPIPSCTTGGGGA